MPKLRRGRIFYLPCNLLGELLSGDVYMRVSGLPANAITVPMANYDFESHSVKILAEHPSFEEVGEGERAPNGGMLDLHVVTSLELEQRRTLSDTNQGFVRVSNELWEKAQNAMRIEKALEDRLNALGT